MVSKKLEKTVYKMFTEKTGKSLIDSGDSYGRHWEKNADKTLRDFKNAKAVEVDDDEAFLTVNSYHYLTSGVITLDETCEKFNDKLLPFNNWDGETYGISDKADEWLKLKKEGQGFNLKNSFNTYNGECILSQVLQGTLLYEKNGDDYVLLQLHQGCDVRGGYTDARLFKINEFIKGCPRVTGVVTLKNGETVDASNFYDGVYLRKDKDDEKIDFDDVDDYDLRLIEF